MTEVKHDISILKEAPMLLRLAKEMVNYLPKSKDRDTLIRNILEVKRSLIDLDVFLQDLEWNLTEIQYREKYESIE